MSVAKIGMRVIVKLTGSTVSLLSSQMASRSAAFPLPILLIEQETMVLIYPHSVDLLAKLSQDSRSVGMPSHIHPPKIAY